MNQSASVAVNGELIRQRREALGLSRCELAHRASLQGWRLPEHVVIRLETGRARGCRTEYLYALSQLLDMRMDDLMDVELAS